MAVSLSFSAAVVALSGGRDSSNFASAALAALEVHAVSANAVQTKALETELRNVTVWLPFAGLARRKNEIVGFIARNLQ